MTGWPSEVELRIIDVFSPHTSKAQRMLWMGFGHGATRLYEYRDDMHIHSFHVRAGFGGCLSVLQVDKIEIKSRDFESYVPLGTMLVRQIWTREACRAAVALWGCLRNGLRLDRSQCQAVAWLVAKSYENPGWEPARK